MRILHVLEAIEGGVAFHVRTLAAAQCALGHDVAVAGPEERTRGVTDRSFWGSVEPAGVIARKLRFHHIPLHPRNGSAVWKLYRFMQVWQPDIVHSHSTAAGALARPLARRLRLPSVHTPNGVRFSQTRRTVASVGEHFLERTLAAVTSKVIAVSESEASVLSSAYNASKVAVVPNGLVASDEPPDAFPDRPRVVSVARMTYVKAPELTVRIMAALRRRRPRVQAVMVGNGELAAEIEALRNEVDPGIQLAFHGLEGREAIRSATVVLLTSRSEGGPYVPMEAMERSRPVVATDVVGSRDIVDHGRTGYLFPFGDVDAAASRLVELVDDRGLAQAMGRAGRDRLLARYTLDRMVEALHRVYNDVGAKRG